MITQKVFFSFFILLLTYNSNSQQQLKHFQIEIPGYYTSVPLKIEKGKYKKELLNNNEEFLLSLEKKINLEKDDIDIESLCFYSIRLYELGKIDEAFFWFHTAKIRCLILIDCLDSKQLLNLDSEEFKLVYFINRYILEFGKNINENGFYDLQKAIGAMKLVSKNILGIHKLENVYLKFKFDNKKKFQIVRDTKKKELENAIYYLEKNQKEIIKKRKSKGLPNKTF